MVGPFAKNSSEMYTYLQGSRNFKTTAMRIPIYKSQPSNIGNMSSMEVATQQRIRDTLDKRRIKNERHTALQAIEEEEKIELERERQLSHQRRLDAKTPIVNPHDIIERANTFTNPEADKFITQQPRPTQGKITDQDKKGLTVVSF
jgi:uncharacterized protein YaiL (DUF2058 family)